MRGDDTAAAEFEQLGKDRFCQRLPLFGIGAAAQFVDQHEAARIRTLGDLDHIFDMRGKGGKVLLDALRISDIGKNIRKDGHFAPLRRGDKDAAARHHAEEAAHFERNRLAARIGPRNQQKAIFAAERYGHGHRRFRIEQRMAALYDVDRARCAQSGTDAFVFIGIFRLCERTIDLGQAAHIFRKLWRHAPHSARQRG